MSGFTELLSGIANAATGGLGKEIIDKISDHFPPDLTPEQKANIQLATDNLILAREKETNLAVAAAETAINERVSMYEGTAKDLMGIPFLGSIILFLRGSQRIAWGYGALYFDWLWFFTPAKLPDRQEIALLSVNILVLGFLFGERAIKNLLPLFTEFLQTKKG